MSVYALLEYLVPRKLEEVVTVVIFTLWVLVPAEPCLQPFPFKTFSPTGVQW